MNAVAFSVLAVLIVAAALACVVLPRLRDAGAGLAAALVVVAILCAASGEFVVAAALVLAAAGAVATVRTVMPLGRSRDGAVGRALPPRRSWIALGVALGFGALLVVVLAMSGSSFVSGGTPPSEVTVLGGHEPYALVIGLVLAAAGVGVGALLGRTSADERAADAREAARRTRDEHMRARRAAREAARRARREAATSGGGSA